MGLTCAFRRIPSCDSHVQLSCHCFLILRHLSENCGDEIHLRCDSSGTVSSSKCHIHWSIIMMMTEMMIDDFRCCCCCCFSIVGWERGRVMVAEWNHHCCFQCENLLLLLSLLMLLWVIWNVFVWVMMTIVVVLWAFSFGCWVVAVDVVVDVVVSHSLCCVVHWMDDQRSEESFLVNMLLGSRLCLKCKLAEKIKKKLLSGKLCGFEGWHEF